MKVISEGGITTVLIEDSTTEVITSGSVVTTIFLEGE